MKKIRKSHIFSFILGALIFGSVGVIAANYAAKNIAFTPKNTNWKKEDGTDITNVKDALDNLYSKNNKVEVYNKLFNNNKYSLKNGTTIKKDSNGNYYFDFDGLDDYIQLATIPESTNFSDGFTIEFKAKWDAFKDYSRIFDFGNGMENFNLTIDNADTSNQLQFLSRDRTSMIYNRVGAITLDTTNVSTYKIIVTKAEANQYNIKYYKNNELINEYTENAGFPNAERTTNYIGKSNWSNNAYFDGQIYYLKIKQADGTNIVDVDANDIFK